MLLSPGTLISPLRDLDFLMVMDFIRWRACRKAYTNFTLNQCILFVVLSGSYNLLNRNILSILFLTLNQQFHQKSFQINILGMTAYPQMPLLNYCLYQIR